MAVQQVTGSRASSDLLGRATTLGMARVACVVRHSGGEEEGACKGDNGGSHGHSPGWC